MARQLGIQFVGDRLQRRSNGSWREGEARDTQLETSQLHTCSYVLTTIQWPCR